ncbi:SH3 domain-containing protein [Gottfriedia acidiceleris]|uniref:SH3 domain-containing protein n=1 Tax=Gottfriedia acidiceleris TaxID=371036 RepID=UPI0030003E9C
MMPTISTFWLAITQGIRITILLLILLLVFKRGILLIAKYSTPFLTKFFWWILSLLFFIFENLVGIIYRILRKPIEASWFKKYETFVKSTHDGLSQLGIKWKKHFTNQVSVKKRYTRYVWLIAAIFIFVSYQWPNFSLVSKLEQTETNLLIKFKVTPMDSVSARAAVTDWIDSWSSKTQPAAAVHAKLSLKSGTTRGNIRQSPNVNAKILMTIRSGETVDYLNEESTSSNQVKWYKVKTNDGQIGWISSRIVH